MMRDLRPKWAYFPPYMRNAANLRPKRPLFPPYMQNDREKCTKTTHFVNILPDFATFYLFYANILLFLSNNF